MTLSRGMQRSIIIIRYEIYQLACKYRYIPELFTIFRWWLKFEMNVVTDIQAHNDIWLKYSEHHLYRVVYE